MSGCGGAGARMSEAKGEPSRSAAERALAAALLAKLRAGGDVRARKVRRLRAAIRAGRYENALKLAVAVEKVPRDL